MARLNIENACNEGRKLVGKYPRYCIRTQAMFDLAQVARMDMFDGLIKTFYVGFYQGMKAAKAADRR